MQFKIIKPGASSLDGRCFGAAGLISEVQVSMSMIEWLMSNEWVEIAALVTRRIRTTAIHHQLTGFIQWHMHDCDTDMQYCDAKPGSVYFVETGNAALPSGNALQAERSIQVSDYRSHALWPVTNHRRSAGSCYDADQPFVLLLLLLLLLVGGDA